MLQKCHFIFEGNFRFREYKNGEILKNFAIFKALIYTQNTFLSQIRASKKIL
jgi:hypothetical protein